MDRQKGIVEYIYKLINSNFMIIYNKILDGMCEFYDTSVVLSKRV